MSPANQKKLKEIKARYADLRECHPDAIRRNKPGTYLPIGTVVEEVEWLIRQLEGQAEPAELEAVTE